MNRFFSVALPLSLIVASAQSQTVAPAERPAIRIRIYDYAAIPHPLFQQATARAEQIFAPTGLKIEWFRCRTSMDDPRPGDPVCSAPLGATDIVLRLLTEKMARKLARQSDCAGYAIHTKDGLGAKAGVYMHRVFELERQTNAPRHAILGIFLAHEVGHLLLPDARHSRNGVMRASWTPEVMFRSALGQTHFSPRQRQQILRNARHRASFARASR